MSYFPWLRVCDCCTVIYCQLLYICPKKAGYLFPLIPCSLWCVQVVEYIEPLKSYSLVGTLDNLIINGRVYMRLYLLQIINMISLEICFSSHCLMLYYETRVHVCAWCLTVVIFDIIDIILKPHANKPRYFLWGIPHWMETYGDVSSDAVISFQTNSISYKET